MRLSQPTPGNSGGCVPGLSWGRAKGIELDAAWWGPRGRGVGSGSQGLNSGSLIPFPKGRGVTTDCEEGAEESPAGSG